MNSNTDIKNKLQECQQDNDNWQLTTPVALIIFNRPETTAKVFAAIRQAKPPKLLVIADGPRLNHPGEAEQCAAARAIINQVDWQCEVLTNYSDVNLGCRQRVSSGLDWVFDQVETAIILEDDCLPHHSFFRYCQELLIKYDDEQRIMMIYGDNFQFGRNPTEYSYYFSRYGHCWGWATWRRAWKKYDDSMELWPELKNHGWLHDVLSHGQAADFWAGVFQGVYDGLSSWAYIWQYTLWLNHGLTILPRINLVSNLGFDSGTHTTMKDSPLANMAVEPMNFPLQHPPVIVRHRQADDFTESRIFSGTSPQLALNSPSHNSPAAIIHHINHHENAAALQLINSAPKMPTAMNYGQAVALAKTGEVTAALDCLDRLLNHSPAHTKAITLKKQLSKNLADHHPDHPIIAQVNHLLETNQVAAAFKLLNEAKALKSWGWIIYEPNVFSKGEASRLLFKRCTKNYATSPPIIKRRTFSINF